MVEPMTSEAARRAAEDKFLKDGWGNTFGPFTMTREQLDAFAAEAVRAVDPYDPTGQALIERWLLAPKPPSDCTTIFGQAMKEAVRAERERWRDLLNRCDSTRGCFSCVEPHDVRCPKARAESADQWKGEWACECGREELDAALREEPR
jgi:hypothetical protein